MARVLFLGSVVASVVLLSCTMTLELDRFKKLSQATNPNDDGGGGNGGVDGGSPAGLKYYDVKFGCRGMLSHINETLELRIVDPNNRVQAKAVYADVALPEFSLYLAGIIPKTNGPYRLDWWADHNRQPGYQRQVEGAGIDDIDHAWRRVLADPLPDEDVRLVDNRYEVDFVHDTFFTDIFTDLKGEQISGEDVLLPFTLNVMTGSFAGKTIEVRVLERESQRLVAFHRRARTPVTYTAQVLGVLDSSTEYDVVVYADMNDDFRYSAGDASWKIEMTSETNGIEAGLDLSTAAQSPISTGEP